MKKRCKELIELQGSYDGVLEPFCNRSFIAQFLSHIQANRHIKDDNLYCGKVRLGKFLTQAGFQNDEISSYVESIKPYRIIISCRFKDVLAATDSKHFTSCLSKTTEFGETGCNRIAVEGILNDPYVAVALRRDKAGHILGRAWIRLVVRYTDAGDKYILVYPTYGNISRESIRTVISEKSIPAVTSNRGLCPLKLINYYDDIF